jgi:hypothetical protein
MKNDIDIKNADFNSLNTDLEAIHISRKFLLVIAIILLLPFISQWSTRFVQSNKSPISTGLPSGADLTFIKESLGTRLVENEKVVWVGQPQPGRETASKPFFYVLLYLMFAYIWTILPLLWMCGALDFKLTEIRKPKKTFISLAAVPFFCFGIILLLMPLITYKTDLDEVYVITDAQIFRIADNHPYKMTAFNWRAFGPLEIVRYAPDRADIMFARTYSDDKKSNIGFYGIEQGEIVLGLLEHNLAARKPENFDPNEYFGPRPPD